MSRSDRQHLRSWHLGSVRIEFGTKQVKGRISALSVRHAFWKSTGRVLLPIAEEKATVLDIFTKSF